jgi:nucleoside-diphosphate-sugar epimerase
MSIHQVQSRGIYHSLPVYPSSLSNLSAIITGANGISGAYMLKVLSQSPQRWSKIYCLSRRPPLIPGGLPDNVEHIALDFLKSPGEIAAVLTEKGVKADHVFFYSYIQPPPKPGGALWSDAEEMVRVNVLLLENFLGALKAADVTPKTFMLQTGAKYYGGHLGRCCRRPASSHDLVHATPSYFHQHTDPSRLTL